MTTATLPITNKQSTKTLPSPSEVESRLSGLEYLIRDAVTHCGKRDRGAFDFEDLMQEATIEVWEELKEYPDAPIGYIWQVAYRSAIHSLRRGRSVDKAITQGKTLCQMISLEHLIEKKEGLHIVEDALARRKRRGERPNPTEDIAITRIMLQELWEYLTPRQRQVLELRLQEYSESEAAAVLGITQVSVSNLVIHIKIKAAAVWGDKPTPPPRVKLSPEQARERRKERDRQRAKTPQRKEAMRAYKRRHGEQINARKRARRREKRQLNNILTYC